MVNGHQSEQFSTLLLYLNEGIKGGETSFPRWINAESLKSTRLCHKLARLSYFTANCPMEIYFFQHAALPVTKGEKWLFNLWVWDPLYGA